MVKAAPRKRRTQESATPETRNTPPRWRTLPPDIIHIIVELLKHDKATLYACSLVAREFSRPALSYIGQHITVNHVRRIKQCTQLLTAHSAFQHVRSLDLGVTSKSSKPQNCLDEQLTILETFSRRQMLTCLWLSNMPFLLIESSQRGRVRDIVTALSSTVNNLGLYGCRFHSYTDMISFIRAFPHCDSLYIRDCVTNDKNTHTIESMFSGLPEHKLSLDVLELTSTSSNRRIVDVSSLVGDAALDVSRLSALTCSLGSVEQSRRIAAATSASPIQHFQLGCSEPGGFQAFLNPMAKKWSLESFTIGPMSYTRNRTFWHDAFHNFPTVPRLKEIIIIYYSPNTSILDTSYWAYFNVLFSRKDIFPPFMKVDIRATLRPSPSIYLQQKALYETFFLLRSCRRVTYWGDPYRWPTIAT